MEVAAAEGEGEGREIGKKEDGTGIGEEEIEAEESDSVVVVYNVTVVGGGHVEMVCAAIPVLDARIEEGVDNIETAEELV